MGKITLKFHTRSFLPHFLFLKLHPCGLQRKRVEQRPWPVSSAWKADVLEAHVVDLRVVGAVKMFPSNENNSSCVFLFLLF